MATTKYINWTKGVNVRATPAGKIVGELAHKSQVVALDHRKNALLDGVYHSWRAIVMPDDTLGYVSDKFLVDVPPATSPAPQPALPWKATDTRVGIHAFATVRNNQHAYALRELKARGKPLAGMVIVKVNPPWVNSDIRIRDLRAISPTTKFAHRIYRKEEAGEMDWSRPNLGTEYATRYYQNFLLGPNADGYDLKDADYDILINEPPPTRQPDYYDPVIHARFWNQVMDVAEPLGRHVAWGCFSERNPQYTFWTHPDIERLIDRAIAKGHILNIHTYVIDPTADPRNAQGRCYSWEYTDFQSHHLYRFVRILELLPERQKKIPIWVMEFSDITYLRCGVDHFVAGLKAANGVLQQYPNVNVSVWTWDTGGSDDPRTDAGGANVAGWTPQYIDAVTG